MSDVRVSYDDVEDKTVNELVEGLPPHFPKKEDSNNFKIFGAIADELDRLEADIGSVEASTKVTEADSVEDLASHGALVDQNLRTDEGLERYRGRIISTLNSSTGNGTIRDVMQSAAVIANVSIDEITYFEQEEAGLIQIGIPGSSLDFSQLSPTDIANLLDQNVAIGYTVQTIGDGTLVYASVEDYDNGDHVAPGLGYATLDENGEPTDGGTYSGGVN